MFSPVLKRSLATAATGAVALSVPSQTVHAEEKKKSSSKLSIYDDPQPDIVIVEAPTKLEEHLAYAQKYADDKVKEGKTYAESLVTEWKKFEQCVKSTVKETIDKDEEILPNALYVGVAALAGTILARNRNIVIRFATSTALAVGTSYYLLPKTTHNVGVQLEKLERRYPPLQEAHQEVNKVVLDARKQAENAWSQLLGAVDENSGKLLSQFRSQDQAKEQFENVKKSVESMYSTRSNPSVEETLKKNN